MNLHNIGKQIAAARALADWTAAELADRAGLSRDGVMKIEGGAVQPRTGTLADITAAFASIGIEFTERGVRFADDVIKVLEGDDAYLRMLDDITYVTHKSGGEVLFFCADDRSTRPGEQEIEERIRAAGVRFRCLIEAGNDFTRWPRREYRQIPGKYFNHNLQVIYADKVAQMIDGGSKILIIRNASLATTARNIFNLVWSQLPPMPKAAAGHG
jgi:transcriptional regulator with XRE-family HTH domain